jgi:hypothetical protein
VCGFPCEAFFVGSTFSFTCDICEAIEETTLTRTTMSTESYAEWSERNEAADRVAEDIHARAFELLAAIERNTARVRSERWPRRT